MSDISYPDFENHTQEAGRPAYYPDDCTHTEGYDNHRQELDGWFRTITQDRDLEAGYEQLEVFQKKYGLEPTPLNEQAEPPNKKPLYRPDVQLQAEHIASVILSPRLGLYQKADLLSLSAQALYESQPPVDGRQVVNRELNSWQRETNKLAQDTDEPNRHGVEALRQHIIDVREVVSESLPRMSRGEFTKHKASAISGKKVTNTLRALGIVLAASELPTPEEQQEKEDKRIARQEKIKQFDRQMLINEKSKAMENVRENLNKINDINTRLDSDT